MGVAARTSESDSDSDSVDTPPGSPNASLRGGDAKVREMWQQLCIMPQGKMYNSGSLSLDLKQEYSGSMGRLTIMFTNPGKDPIGNIRVVLPEVQTLRFQQPNAVPTSLASGQQAPHFVQVQLMRPFLQPAKYLVEYCEKPGEKPIQLSFMLPCVMTKFLTPAEMEMQQFRQYFDSFEGKPRENVTVGQPKVPPNQWPNYITKGFNMSLIPGSSPSDAMAAGTLNTGTPDPSKQGSMMTVPCMLRLEYNESANMVRLTTRSQHGEATNALYMIVVSYLITPSN